MSDDEADQVEEEQHAIDTRRVKKAVAELGVYFDTVQVFVTRDNGADDGTMHHSWGKGNYFARSGQIREWIVQQDHPPQPTGE